MKLSHKLFTVHLLVSFVLLLLVGATFEFYASRHFQEMADRIETEILTVLSYELALEYQRSKNWDEFKNNPGRFEEFIQGALKNRGDFPQFHAPQAPPFPPGKPDPSRPPPLHRNITLYDAGKTRIAGPEPMNATPKFRPIRLHGQTLGWLALHPDKGLPRPGKDLFFRGKSEIFYTVGIIVFILAGLVSYGLSRYILSPVNKLMAGTMALMDFKFDTRIEVGTKDELGLLAQDFNRMAKTLEAYEALKKQWAVDISHELRTPLSILKGEIEAILDGIRPFSPERMESLHSEILYLEHIVEDLHFLSMADAGALTMKTEPIRPVEILKTTLVLFETRFEQEGLTVVNRLTCHKEKISGDRDRIRQLFSNLIDNSLKYTRKPGTLTLADRIENRMLIIVIEDSGPGVPPEAVDKLFNRLYRVDPSRNRGGGSGLGLSICKTIVSAHGGEIFAGTTKGSGLAITLKLPLI
ncbi:MAG: ATP-binding protein [Desulfobacula sp.]|nr:ATP-binding protein [Desulfobacula sp.]